MDPSGLRIETFACDMVTDESFRLIRRPLVPVNVTTAFWPGMPVATVTGTPPGAMAAVLSAGTE